MPLNITTNSAASAAGYYLEKNQNALQKSLTRLASGKKIIAPYDDPGSLSVINRYRRARKEEIESFTYFTEAMHYMGVGGIDFFRSIQKFGFGAVGKSEALKRFFMVFQNFKFFRTVTSRIRKFR